MRPLTYLITICLLIISSQVYSQNLCDTGFLSGDVTALTACDAGDGTIDITLTGGIDPFTFSWTGPNGFFATTEDIVGLEEGIYEVAISDANGVECVQFYEVSDGFSCTASVTQVNCNLTGAIAISCEGGVPPYTYLWSVGETTAEIDATIFGTYTVTVTDANGCEIIEIFNPASDPNSYCDTMYIDPVQVSVGNQIRVDFVVTDFNNIIAMQYAIQYDPTILILESVGDFNPEIADLGVTNFNIANSGYVNFSWFEDPIGGVTIPNGSVMYSLFFTPLTTESSDVYIDSNPITIEVLSSTLGLVYVETSSATIVPDGNVLSGNIYKDENGNCENDSETPLPSWPINLTNGADEWNIVTNSEGFYSVVLPDGSYEINLTPVNENWELCNNNITTDVNQSVSQDFGAVALIDCPAMEVDIAIPVLFRCFPNQINVNYCNYGTVEGADTYVEIELDPEMSFIDADVTPSSINGNLLTFELGDIGIGQCGSFYVTVLLDDDCDSSVLGQAHCTTATIFPNAPCTVDPLWDGASLELTGSCDGTDVNFIIENVGTGNMTETSSFIVIEDHVMGQSIPEDFLLAPGASITISKPANGTTYYMSVNQVPKHPGNSNPSVAVEGCGTNDQGEISLGIVTQYGQDDADGFVDIECVENVGSYDPNDKAAMLKGFGDEHFIYANEPMEYLVRFQNTGTASAFNVVVKDELSPNFDITSLRVGASSHDYTFSIENERTMVFTFENINLPDSTSDLAGSNGFLSYKVDQLLDLPDGTVLENTADIYFDFNEAIVTNTTVHTIGSDFISTATFYDNELEIENSISIYPNPSDDIITFELAEWNTKMQLEIFDVTGKQISTQTFDGEKIILSKNAMQDGMYFYSVSSNGKQLTSGKFIFL